MSAPLTCLVCTDDMSPHRNWICTQCGVRVCYACHDGIMSSGRTFACVQCRSPAAYVKIGGAPPPAPVPVAAPPVRTLSYADYVPPRRDPTAAGRAAYEAAVAAKAAPRGRIVRGTKIDKTVLEFTDCGGFTKTGKQCGKDAVTRYPAFNVNYCSSCRPLFAPREPV